MQIYCKYLMTFAFFICATFSLFSCGKAEAALKKDTPEVGTPDELIGLSISHTHMSRFSAYSFELRDDNGDILFSCNFFTPDGEEFKLENVNVEPENMRRLREILKEYGFANMKERNTAYAPFVHDAPMYGITMRWPDRKSLRLNYRPAPGGEELEKFFRTLAEEYK